MKLCHSACPAIHAFSLYLFNSDAPALMCICANEYDKSSNTHGHVLVICIVAIIDDARSAALLVAPASTHGCQWRHGVLSLDAT